MVGSVPYTSTPPHKNAMTQRNADLEAGDDLAHEVAGHAVRLDHDICARMGWVKAKDQDQINHFRSLAPTDHSASQPHPATRGRSSYAWTDMRSPAVHTASARRRGVHYGACGGVNVPRPIPQKSPSQTVIQTCPESLTGALGRHVAKLVVLKPAWAGGMGWLNAR